MAAQPGATSAHSAAPAKRAHPLPTLDLTHNTASINIQTVPRTCTQYTDAHWQAAKHAVIVLGMTYAAAAKHSNVSPDAIRQRASREGWRKRDIKAALSTPPPPPPQAQSDAVLARIDAAQPTLAPAPPLDATQQAIQSRRELEQVIEGKALTIVERHLREIGSLPVTTDAANHAKTVMQTYRLATPAPQVANAVQVNVGVIDLSSLIERQAQSS